MHINKISIIWQYSLIVNKYNNYPGRMYIEEFSNQLNLDQETLDKAKTALL